MHHRDRITRFRLPSFSAAKARWTTALLAATVDSCPADEATAAAVQSTMRLAQSSLRIQDFLQEMARTLSIFCSTNGGLRQLLIETGGFANPDGYALALACLGCPESFGEGSVCITRFCIAVE